MQLAEEDLAKSIVVISFQFSTFVSLMQLILHSDLDMSSLRRFIEREKPVVLHRLFL